MTLVTVAWNALWNFNLFQQSVAKLQSMQMAADILRYFAHQNPKKNLSEEESLTESKGALVSGRSYWYVLLVSSMEVTLQLIS